jgi:hypothetical protein
LGDHWKRIFTDETVGSKGNDERMVFVYDSRKVSFEGLASELVLPPVKDENGVEQPVTQLARTPFMVGFKSNWSSFILTTVHIIWGASEAEPERRVREIQVLSDFLKERTEDEDTWSRNIILLGDFNIFGTDDETFQALTSTGFQVPEPLLEFRSNAKKTRHYDQIAFIERPGHVELTGKAGVFDYYQSVFKDTEEDKQTYMEYMTEFETKADGTPRSEKSKKNYYQTYWRTHQMSDHLPMWMELKIDFSDEYLQGKL